MKKSTRRILSILVIGLALFTGYAIGVRSHGKFDRYSNQVELIVSPQDRAALHQMPPGTTIRFQTYDSRSGSKVLQGTSVIWHPVEDETRFETYDRGVLGEECIEMINY